MPNVYRKPRSRAGAPMGLSQRRRDALLDPDEDDEQQHAQRQRTPRVTASTHPR